MTRISIHGFAQSTFTRTATMAAIELDIDYELVPLAFGKPEHLELHPFAKMPVLTDGDRTVFESLAILAYLDDIAGGNKLFPGDTDSRVQTMCAVSVALDYAYDCVVQVTNGSDTPDDGKLSSAEAVFDWVDGELRSKPYLSGKAFGAADLFFAPMLDYHIAQAGSDHVFHARPALQKWVSDTSKRASFVNTSADR